jgi:hypothetical protein
MRKASPHGSKLNGTSMDNPSALKKKQARDKRADGRILLAFHLFHRLFAAHQLARWFATAWLINEDNQTAFLALVLLTFRLFRHSSSPPFTLLRMNPYIFRSIKLFSKRVVTSQARLQWLISTRAAEHELHLRGILGLAFISCVPSCHVSVGEFELLRVV